MVLAPRMEKMKEQKGTRPRRALQSNPKRVAKTLRALVFDITDFRLLKNEEILRLDRSRLLDVQIRRR